MDLRTTILASRRQGECIARGSELESEYIMLTSRLSDVKILSDFFHTILMEGVNFVDPEAEGDFPAVEEPDSLEYILQTYEQNMPEEKLEKLLDELCRETLYSVCSVVFDVTKLLLGLCPEVERWQSLESFPSMPTLNDNSTDLQIAELEEHLSRIEARHNDLRGSSTRIADVMNAVLEIVENHRQIMQRELYKTMSDIESHYGDGHMSEIDKMFHELGDTLSENEFAALMTNTRRLLISIPEYELCQVLNHVWGPEGQNCDLEGLDVDFKFAYDHWQIVKAKVLRHVSNAQDSGDEMTDISDDAIVTDPRPVPDYMRYNHRPSLNLGPAPVAYRPCEWFPKRSNV